MSEEPELEFNADNIRRAAIEGQAQKARRLEQQMKQCYENFLVIHKPKIWEAARQGEEMYRVINLNYADYIAQRLKDELGFRIHDGNSFTSLTIELHKVYM